MKTFTCSASQKYWSVYTLNERNLINLYDIKRNDDSNAFDELERRFGPFRNRNRKLLISRAPTKAKSQEPAYSEALNQNKIDRQRSRSRESGRQTVRRLWWMVFGVETGR